MILESSHAFGRFGTRLKKYQKAVPALNIWKSALAEHVCDIKHVVAWDYSKVIIYGQRRWLELWYINM